MIRLVAILSVLSCFLVAAFGDEAFSTEQQRLAVEDAWAPPSLDGASVGTAFVTIANHGDKDLTIHSLSSPVATTVELHTHVMENGKMQMRRVEPMEIPAHGTLSMKPGGLHLMLIGLRRPITDSETITVTLKLTDGYSQSIAFPVSQARLLEALKSRSNHMHAH